jgi:hypothetical protein
METRRSNWLDEPPTTLFPLELTRIPFLVRFLIWFVTVGTVAALLVAIPVVGGVVGVLWVLSTVVYKIVAMDTPRIKNVGFSPWLLWLYLVPVINVGIVLILFFAPPKIH